MIDSKQYISDEGIFDARAARVELFAATRNNRILRQVSDVARSNGLSEVDMLLLSALSLAIAYEESEREALERFNCMPMPPFVVPGGPEKL